MTYYAVRSSERKDLVDVWIKDGSDQFAVFEGCTLKGAGLICAVMNAALKGRVVWEAE